MSTTQILSQLPSKKIISLHQPQAISNLNKNQFSIVPPKFIPVSNDARGHQQQRVTETKQMRSVSPQNYYALASKSNQLIPKAPSQKLMPINSKLLPAY